MLVQIDTDGTTKRELKQLTQVDVDGTTIRTLKQLWQNDASGTPRLIYASLSAVAAPAPPPAFGSSGGFMQVTTASCTATPSGGATPYTYLWTVDEPGWVALASTSATTAFRSPSIAPGDSSTTAARCTVTDDSGTVVDTNDITVSAYNIFAF